MPMMRGFTARRLLPSCPGDSLPDCAMCSAPDEGMRPSFLGHILVEILLDAS